MATLSLILAAAAALGAPCEAVFTETALSAVCREMAMVERALLDRLALAACRTSNPDAVWRIAHAESRFRFVIVRINATSKVLEGDEAIEYLATAQTVRDGKRANIDIGAMQLSYRWHGGAFDDPASMMDPMLQVKYLTGGYSEKLAKSCGDGWFECYHNPWDRAARRRYHAAIERAGVELSTALMDVVVTEASRRAKGGGLVATDPSRKFQKLSKKILRFAAPMAIDLDLSKDVERLPGGLVKVTAKADPLIRRAVDARRAEARRIAGGVRARVEIAKFSPGADTRQRHAATASEGLRHRPGARGSRDAIFARVIE